MTDTRKSARKSEQVSASGPRRIVGFCGPVVVAETMATARVSDSTAVPTNKATPAMGMGVDKSLWVLI